MFSDQITIFSLIFVEKFTHFDVKYLLQKKFAPKTFSVRLRNLLISAGLVPDLSHTEKSCIVSYSKIKFHGAKKNAFDINFLYFNILGELSIIRCDK